MTGVSVVGLWLVLSSVAAASPGTVGDAVLVGGVVGGDVCGRSAHQFLDPAHPSLPAGPARDAYTAWMRAFHWADDPTPLLDGARADGMSLDGVGPDQGWRALLLLAIEDEALQEIEAKASMSELGDMLEGGSPDEESPAGIPGRRARLAAYAERLAAEAAEPEVRYQARLYAIRLGASSSAGAVDPSLVPALLDVAESAVGFDPGEAALGEALFRQGPGAPQDVQARFLPLFAAYPQVATAFAVELATDAAWPDEAVRAPIDACVRSACACDRDDASCHEACVRAQALSVHRGFTPPAKARPLQSALGGCANAGTGWWLRSDSGWDWHGVVLEWRRAEVQDPVACAATPRGRAQAILVLDGEPVASSP